MFTPIWTAESNANLRRCPASVVSSTGHTAGDVASLVGTKARCFKSDGTAFNSAGDIAYYDSATAPGLIYVPFSLSEIDTVGPLVGYGTPPSGDPIWFQANIFPYNVWADGATLAQIAAIILANPANKLATDGSGNVALSAASATALLATLLGTVIESSGGKTLTVRQALSAGASLALGEISGITDGTGVEVVTLKSATGQIIATFPTDGIGNRNAATITYPS